PTASSTRCCKTRRALGRPPKNTEVRHAQEALMAKVSKYSILFYSGEQGYQNNRAQVTLADADGNSRAFARFKDPGMRYELDTETDGMITMHLPSAMLPSILDAVRNEKTDIYYQIGQALLFRKLKRAGQGWGAACPRRRRSRKSARAQSRRCWQAATRKSR